ncbi:MAG: imidazolonepropionase [Lachnospiraceae bacterium]|nr:imidazolonepropionase [Lachnospiraceae bacterium]
MDTIITDISMIATPLGISELHGKAMNSLRIYKDCSIIIEESRIAFIGSFGEAKKYLSENKKNIKQYIQVDGRGKCALPGFTDSHTHFVFGGYRPDEFMLRLEGGDYMEIHRRGGGIEASVQATRAETETELYKKGKIRLEHMLRQGVTCVEGKSGYGLDLDTEIKQLKVMKKLNENQPVSVIPTFLGAHSVAGEYRERGDEYIDFIINKVMPVVAGERLAKFCDAFVEAGVINVRQGEKLFQAAQRYNLKIKIHADEMTSMGAVELALRYDAVSADHLLMISEEDIKRLSQSRTVATLLPATAFCLNKPYAPARKMIDSNCAVALASDFNPGSCFSDNIPLLISLAVIQMRMTIEEAVTALTLNGAAAADCAGYTGSIEVGKNADIILLGCPDYKYLVYYTMENLVDTVIKKGVIIKENHYEM